MEGVELELERRSKVLSSLIQQKKKAKEQHDLNDEFNVRVRASDMPLVMQNRAFGLSRELLNATPGKADNKRLALSLKKGPTDFTETLSRITIMTLAITIKTRGIADADHLVYLQTMLEQVLATSQHTWSEKTLRHFPSLLRDALIGRVDKRGLSIQAWQQAETTVLNQCTQLLSPAAEPSYVMTYLSHSFPQHRQYLCAGACLLMQGNPDKINSANLIVSSLVQIIVNIQSTLIQSGNGFHGAANGVGQGSSVLPTSPSGGSTDSMSASRSSCMNTASFVSRSGYTCQQLSCLLIQACGLLLAQLPPEFHTHFYVEASRVTRETWWLSDGKRSQGEVDSAVGYALMDPTWAAQDNTSTAIGNVVALLHAFFSNLPQEWLDGTHLIIKNLRPVTSVAMLRVAFRIMGPLLPRLANTHALFNKTLALLLSTMVDVFGKNSQTPVPVEASQIADLIDFLHHVVHYEGQGGAVQSSSKPRPDTLALIGRAADSLRPDVQHLLSHLRTDPNSSIYAAAHQNTAKTNTS
ncbi:hypothetical protein DY000_02046273 [Brassica cretica]|uniref:Uncharacterized protein n=1 Tax=Brassica cretica TaxID=69181 RepID=A0ABQ7F0D8_BRACR|nr:hypothetical protein DY000_02046273 [Brassica cretica]